MKKLSLLPVFLLTIVCGYAQVSTKLAKKADSLYTAKNYSQAASFYLQAADSSDKFVNPKSLYYNAACCYALVDDKELAMKYLKIAIQQYGYKNYDNLIADNDLRILHTDPEWDKLTSKLKAEREAMRDPRKAKLVTSDIHNFWTAFDKAEKDTGRRKEIFMAEYFNKASLGLLDYYATKIQSVDRFVENQRRKPEFYKAIRQNTLAIDSMKPHIYGYFEQLKSMYDDAVFPDIYFVIGRWNSAGTASDNGLLLGVDQISKTPGIPEHELNLWEKNNYTEARRVPVIVIHELIHFEQRKMKQDTTLLYYALAEGMCDFICELITGVNPSQRQQDYAKSRRKEIWADFKKEIYLQRYSNWLANGNQETKDKPADLGYYVGYEICKAYYEKASDKKAAILDILTMQDHKAFLEKSGYEEKVAGQ